MSPLFRQRRWQMLLVGLFIGLVLGVLCGLSPQGLFPHTPLHASATDRNDTFAIATGAVDEDVEAIYFLDFLTGDLRALVLGKQAGKFTGMFEINAAQYLGIDPSKNPKYLLVTGVSDLRRGGAKTQPSRAVAYVAELTSGKVAVFAIPWDMSMNSAGRLAAQPLIPVAVEPFRAPAKLLPAGK